MKKEVKKYLDLTRDYACLRHFITAQKKVEEGAKDAAAQLSLGF